MRNCLLAIALLSPLFVTHVLAQSGDQPVYSVTNLGERESASGAEYTLVMVKCHIHDELRYIHRNDGSRSWCAYGLSDKCDEDRIQAAAYACFMSNEEVAEVEGKSSQSIANVEPRIDPAEKARMERRAQLENELISLQQKRLEIRSRQLELNRREMELIKRRDANIASSNPSP